MRGRGSLLRALLAMDAWLKTAGRRAGGGVAEQSRRGRTDGQTRGDVFEAADADVI